MRVRTTILIEGYEVEALAGAAAMRVCGVREGSYVSVEKIPGSSALEVTVDRDVCVAAEPAETAQETVEAGEGHSCTMQGEVCDVEE